MSDHQRPLTDPSLKIPELDHLLGSPLNILLYKLNIYLHETLWDK